MQTAHLKASKLIMPETTIDVKDFQTLHLTKAPKEPLIYRDFYMLHLGNFLDRIEEVRGKSKLAFIIYRLLERKIRNRRKGYTPFVEIVQKDLAKELKQYPQHINGAFKILIESELVVKVQTGIFLVNPKYVFQGNLQNRDKWLLCGRYYGYKHLYEAYKTGKLDEVLDTFISIMSEDTRTPEEAYAHEKKYIKPPKPEIKADITELPKFRKNINKKEPK